MSDKPDMSAIFSMLASGNDGSMKPEELLSKLMSSSSFKNSSMSENSNSKEEQSSNSNESKNDKTQSTDGISMPDMEMVMKLMRVMKSSNQDSPSKDLLKSLKPFLSESRKEKVDQYIKILGVTKAIEMFQEMGEIPHE